MEGNQARGHKMVLSDFLGEWGTGLLWAFLCLISSVRADENVFWRYAGGRPDFICGRRCALPAKEELKYLNRKGYDLCYSPRLKSCVWIAYALTPNDVTNQLGRIGYFRQDDDLLTETPSPKSYGGSGYDRGHMAPSQDMQYTEEVSRQSFWMGNIMPQLPRLNRGEWKRLEGKIHRKVVPNDHGEVESRRVYVMTGPVFTREAIRQYEKDVQMLKNTGEGKEPFLKPERYWKIFKYGVMVDAVVMDQSGNAQSVTVEEISQLTGLRFFQRMQDDLRAFYLRFKRPIYGNPYENEENDDE